MANKKMQLKRELPKSFKDGKWLYETQKFEVTVLSIVGIWAMIRRPGCVPFVEHIKNLYEI